MPISFTERLKLSKGNQLIMTYRGAIDGRDFFAYILCDKRGVYLLHDDWGARKARAISEYGQVIYRDDLKDPDKKARDFLKHYLSGSGGEMI